MNFSVRVVKTLTMRDGKSPLTTCESKQKGLGAVEDTDGNELSCS